ncbi:unnamed protein product [Didymodactylos carnosus]|uniref:Stress-response A/B barrel domain-containing protein n=1 Tax=Didymodactylos carnosus TaxID=1234261 RepID=A0A815SZ54_9BILA|nr:unnamed protein product [Didymodactylos carnosus]CAF1499426.1 unnamed protein product [Didymodactylos carnosus]CAF4160000.1 unnamed protein product [Didymodactylos carnosus]CAF4361360.1 unnamed protein product [Didymodactylos carnosus]
MANSNKLLRHVVLLKFKDDTKSNDLKNVEDAFCELENKISCIKSFECGQNVSKEGLSQGFTHCYLLTFRNEQDRDEYLVHPEHKAFVKLLTPYKEKGLVIDYWNA